MLQLESPRRGLTLVEVILVLALLVVIGGFAAPLLQGSFSRAGLNSAGDLLRGAWAKARLAAMQTGYTHAFRFEPGGSRYQIVALNELVLPELNELPPDDNREHKAIDMLRITRNRLPDSISFTHGEISTSYQLAATLPESAEGPWSAPILFYSDGTTSDASVLLSNDRQMTLRVTLRGLTGISNTSDGNDEHAP